MASSAQLCTIHTVLQYSYPLPFKKNSLQIYTDLLISISLMVLGVGRMSENFDAHRLKLHVGKSAVGQNMSIQT